MEVLSIVLKDHLGIRASCYMDDVIIYSADLRTHKKDVEKVLGSFKQHNFKLSAKKSVFATNECTFLGHSITDKGTMPSPTHTEAVRTFPTPTTLKKLKGFLGLCSYFSAYIDKKGQLMAPLLKLTKRTSRTCGTKSVKNPFKH